MKKILFVLTGLLLLSSCAMGEKETVVVAIEKTNFYELDGAGIELYFKYPDQAKVVLTDERMSEGEVQYQECNVEFGFSPVKKGEEALVFDDDISNSQKDRSYYSYFQDNELVGYVVAYDPLNFGFWTENEIVSAQCMDFVDFLSESITDSSDYRNTDFGFSVPLVDGYDVEYLSEGRGIVMRKWFEVADTDRDMEHEERFPKQYRVEIQISAFLNDGMWVDLSDFIGKEYAGYSVEFFGDGIWVNEDSGDDAIRHFYMMSENNEIIYEAYLKVPRVYFGWHSDFFDENVAEKLTIF